MREGNRVTVQRASRPLSAQEGHCTPCTPRPGPQGAVLPSALLSASFTATSTPSVFSRAAVGPSAGPADSAPGVPPGQLERGPPLSPTAPLRQAATQDGHDEGTTPRPTRRPGGLGPGCPVTSVSLRAPPAPQGDASFPDATTTPAPCQTLTHTSGPGAQQPPRPSHLPLLPSPSVTARFCKRGPRDGSHTGSSGDSRQAHLPPGHPAHRLTAVLSAH